jgi:hypothetical protein
VEIELATDWETELATDWETEIELAIFLEDEVDIASDLATE